jgi:pimeloyl-ACP methyl ester carboxylesterase
MKQLTRLVIATALTLGCTTAGWVDDSPHESGFVTVNGVTLNYLDWGGTGDALLFLPGLADSPHIFDDIAPEFVGRYRVLALARRGVGQSDKPASGYENEVLVEDIRQFLDSLGVPRASLVGWSMGGNELTGVATRYPERVEKLVYLDAAYDRSDTAFIALLTTYPVETPLTSQDLGSLDAIRDWMTDGWAKGFPWSDATEAWLRDIVRFRPDSTVEFVTSDAVRRALIESLVSYQPDFSKIRSPALAIYAFWPPEAYVDEEAPEDVRARVDDWLERRVYPFHRRSMDRFAREVANSRVIQMPATHHWCFLHKRDEVLREMRRFLLDDQP